MSEGIVARVIDASLCANPTINGPKAMIDVATKQGVHLVASAGNTGHALAYGTDTSVAGRRVSDGVAPVLGDGAPVAASSRSPPIAGDDDQTRPVGSGRLDGRRRGCTPGGATGFGVSRVETARLVPVPA